MIQLTDHGKMGLFAICMLIVLVIVGTMDAQTCREYGVGCP